MVKELKPDLEREKRIETEVVVDAYGEDEPTCIEKRAASPLQVRDEVEVIGMAPEEECEHEMFVIARWEKAA